MRKIIIPLAILAIGAIGTVALVATRRTPEPKSEETPPPLVRIEEVHPRDVRLDVSSSGQVVPRTETTLVSEVGGKIMEVSSSLAAGGFFLEGDVLARIDDRDYRAAVTEARANVAQAEVALAREEGEAEIARKEWKELGNEGEPDPLVLREPQMKQAEAALASARARLEKAEADLARTTIRAPYDGRVRAKSVDVGQFVAPGTRLATIWADDAAEVRLAVPTDEIVYLDLPLASDPGADGPPVVLAATLGGEWFRWTGEVVRVEAEIDDRTRMFHVVARVDDPLGRRTGREPVLPMGLFVDASISGRLEAGVFVVPRSAVRRGGTVNVVEDGKLRVRSVRVVRTVRDEAVVRGLEDGDLVVLSNLDLAVDGMDVRVDRGDPESLAGTGGAGSRADTAEGDGGADDGVAAAREGTR
jgi:RND family efflux transporter MFP subunit